MTLTTHALVGAAAASLFPQEPVLAFVAGFASHLAIDAIPHWDYELDSLKKDYAHPLNTAIETGKTFWSDVALVAGDALLGFVLSAFIFSVLLFHLPLWFVSMGVFAALLPDGLHFIYFKTHTHAFLLLERFHIWIQQKSPINVPAWVGLGLQCALVVVSIALLKLFS